MRGYAYLARALCDPGIKQVVTATVYLRTGRVEYQIHTAKQLDAWIIDLRNMLFSGSAKYSPGAHCTHCTLSHSCQAYKNVLNDFNRLAMGDSKAKFEKLSSITHQNRHEPEVMQALTDAHFMAKVMDQLSGAVNSLIRDKVIEHGPLPLNNGNSLVAQVRERKNVSPRHALPVLRTVLSDEQIEKATTLSLGKLSAEMASNQQKGEKGAARDKLIELLKTSGALKTANYTVVSERPGDNDMDAADVSDLPQPDVDL
jgi:hypothetical protein